jgi:hypothetical protein
MSHGLLAQVLSNLKRHAKRPEICLEYIAFEILTLSHLEARAKNCLPVSNTFSQSYIELMKLHPIRKRQERQQYHLALEKTY